MADTYPRPDFRRTALNYQSLNGPWDFIFDDDDVGQAELWHQNGLPSQVTTKAVEGDDQSWLPAAAQSLIENISVQADKIVKNNAFTASSGVTHQKRSITVPYVFQCPASGINERSAHEVLWYQRDITDVRTAEERSRGNRLLVRFGAVDYEAKIWVDGQFVGGHEGGHVPFDVDVTDAFAAGPAASRRLTVRVFDSTSDLRQPRGKQYWGAKPESIFYTPSSGIWQNVWLESVPGARLADSSNGTILRSDDIEGGKLDATITVQGRRAGQRCAVEIEASFNGKVVSTSDKKALPREADSVKLDLNMRLSDEQAKSLPAQSSHLGVALWSPEHPHLYELTLRLYDASSTLLDEVVTTAGMRSISWAHGDGTFRLNNRPIFQVLNLDQGYWPDTLMTPPSAAALRADIELAKAMGFNGCRKHQKIEDPAFLHWADRLGYLVWGEMANAYAFDETYMARFDAEWAAAVRRDRNHASVVAWTPVNESWAYPDLAGSAAQREHIRSLAARTRALDPTRPVNDNCGWEHVAGDLATFHDYSDAAELAATCGRLEGGVLAPKAGGRPLFTADRPIKRGPAAQDDLGGAFVRGSPVICSEFGGVNIAPAEKGGAEDLDWGYTTASDPEDLLKRLEALVTAVVGGGHVCGMVYTQLCDIEQEVNGLYSFDRKPKLDAAKVKAVMDAAQKVYFGGLAKKSA